MNVKNTRMRRLEELPFVWPLSPLGQNSDVLNFLGLFSPCAGTWLLTN